MKIVNEWKNNFGEIRKTHINEFMNEHKDMEWMKIRMTTITDENNIIVEEGGNEFIDTRTGERV